MINILYEGLENNLDYSVTASDCVDIICTVSNITEQELSETIDTNNLEQVYDYAYNNGIRINDIIWQEYKDLDTISDEVFLIHGSRSGIVGALRLDASGDSNDFGNGFYCGTNIGQAGMFVANDPKSSLYIVSFNPMGLKAAKFNVDTDWMIAVAYYRGTIDNYKDNPRVRSIISRINHCDYVIAPIADNRIFETIDAFTSGEITDKQCLYALSTTNLGMQYVFKKQRTLNSIDILDHLYLCDAEKQEYAQRADIESTTSFNKAILAKKKFANVGMYIDELLG